MFRSQFVQRIGTDDIEDGLHRTKFIVRILRVSRFLPETIGQHYVESFKDGVFVRAAVQHALCGDSTFLTVTDIE